MKIWRVKKGVSIFATLCLLVMNINLSFADNVSVESGLQPNLQNLSVAEATYSQPPSEQSVIENVYVNPTSTPMPTIEPTMTLTPTPTSTPTPTAIQTSTSTPTPTATSVSNSVYKETVDYGNDISKAFSISDTTSVSGGLDNTDLSDVFTFISSIKDKDVVVQFNYNNCIVGTILDNYGNQILRQEGHGSGSLSLNFHTVKGIRYYIKVESAHTGEAVNYTIKTISLIDDYRDVFDTATEISIEQSIVGNFVNSSDVDCFKFTTDKKGIYKINSTSYNYKIDIFTENYSVVDITNNYVSLDANKTYYLKISRNSFINAFAYDFSIIGAIEDDYGNTKQSSKEISVGSEVYGELNYLVDSDFFKLKPSEDGIYYIEGFATKTGIDYSVSSINYVLSVYDEKDNSVGVNYDNYSKAYISLSKDKIYYFCISNLNNSVLIKYSFTIQGPIKDDIGNTCESAEEIQLDEQVKGSINYMNDSDYLRFTPSIDGTFQMKDFATVNFDYSSIYLGNIFSIIDSSNNSINIIYNNNAKEVYFNLLKGRTYYLVISNRNYNSLFDYSFSVSGPIKDDFGSTKETATEIQLDTQIKCSADFYYDAEFFSFKPKVSGSYYIGDFTADNNNSLIYNSLAVVNSDGNSVDILRINSKAYFIMLKDVKYYISYTNTDYPSTVNYSFMLKGPVQDDYGNSKETAKAIQLDVPVEGFEDSFDDYDYFSYKPLVSGLYCVDDFSSSSDTYYSLNRLLCVVDTNGNQIPVKFDTLNYKKAYFTLEKDSEYYIYISNSITNSIFVYSFTLKGPIKDDFGDTNESAAEIKLDEEVKGSINNMFDIDVFSFKPSATGLYYTDNFIISMLNGSDYYTSLSYVFNVRDSSGNAVYISFDTKSNQKAYLNLVKDNTYFIYIKCGENLSTFSYSFSLKGPIIDDYGNTSSYAKKLELGKTVAGKFDYPKDNDSFCFTTGAKGYYYVAIPISNGNVTLFDESNIQVNQSSFGMDNTNLDNTKLYYYLRANQTYYVNITAPYFNSVTNYSLQVNGPIIDESYGSVVQIGDNNAGINYMGDTDVFKFFPSSTGTYYLKFNSDIKISMKISGDSNYYGSNFQYKEIDENTISCYLYADNGYYIFVSNNMDFLAIGNYVLTISDNPEIIENKTFKITGYVKPDFTDKLTDSIRSGFKISLAGTNLSAVSDTNGYFEITGIPKSDVGYDIVITKDSYLKREIKGINVKENISISKFEAPIELWVGDIGQYQDGVINIADIIFIAKAFNTIKGDSGYLEGSDLNKDSVINLEDIIIAAKHFNELTESYEQLSL